MAEKIYLGSGKEFGKFGDIKISFRLDTKDGVKVEPNERGYYNFIVSRRKEKDKYNNTHYVALDTWKHDNQQSNSNQAENTDDLPF